VVIRFKDYVMAVSGLASSKFTGDGPRTGRMNRHKQQGVSKVKAWITQSIIILTNHFPFQTVDSCPRSTEMELRALIDSGTQSASMR